MVTHPAVCSLKKKFFLNTCPVLLPLWFVALMKYFTFGDPVFLFAFAF